VIVGNFCPFCIHSYADGEEAETILDYANEMRNFYWSLNGIAANYNATTHGYQFPPATGMLNVLRTMTSPSGIGSLLYVKGHKTCDSIPTSGTEIVEDSRGKFIVSFGGPTEVVPAGWSDAGTPFRKRISVKLSSVVDDVPTETDFLIFEFNCAPSVVGHFLVKNVFADAPESSRNIEAYYDITRENNMRLEMYMSLLDSDTGDAQFLMARLMTDRNNLYRLALAMGQTISGTEKAMRYNIRGNSNTGMANVFLKTSDAISGDDENWTIGNLSIDQGLVSCIRFIEGANAVNAPGECTYLTLEEPDNPIIDRASAWNIDWVSGTMSNVMTQFPPSPES
jgi:hypothetical protein